MSLTTFLSAFLLTYLIHSTLFYILAKILLLFKYFLVPTRSLLIWKTALLLGMLTSGLQVATHSGSFNVLDLFAQKSLEETKLDPGPVNQISTITIINEERSNNLHQGTFHENRNALFFEAKIYILFGIGLSLIFLFYLNYYRFIRSLGNLKTLEDRKILDLLEELKIKCGYNKNTKILITDRINSPAALTRSRILLPCWIVDQMDEDNIKGILAHELGHLLRNDPFWTRLTHLSLAFFYFQPLNYLIRKHLFELMEAAADSKTIELLEDRATYADTLLRVAAKYSNLSFGSPFTRNSQQYNLLSKRIQKILLSENSNNSDSKNHLFTPLLLLSCFLLSFTFPFSSHEIIQEPEVELPITSSQSFHKPSITSPTPIDNISEPEELQKSSSDSDQKKGYTRAVYLSFDPIETTIKPLNYPLDLSPEIASIAPVSKVKTGIKNPPAATSLQAFDLNFGYQSFKKEFWSAIKSNYSLQSYLRKRRGNTISLSYGAMYVNGTRLPHALFLPFQKLIEKHFDSEHWPHFSYKREGYKLPRKTDQQTKASQIISFNSGITLPNSSMIPNSFDKKLSHFNLYLKTLGEAMIEDGLISSLSEMHHLKWRKGKLKFQGKTIKGDQYQRYYQIKRKFYPL